MSERDWLILVGVIVLIIIVLDGVRRMRKRARLLRLDIDNELTNLPEEDFHGELPNGGARRASADSTGPMPDSALSDHSDQDVDLLMDGDLKGVGEGADRWLEVNQQAAQAQEQNSNDPLVSPEALSSESVHESEQGSRPVVRSERRPELRSGQEDELQSLIHQSRQKTDVDEIDLLDQVVTESDVDLTTASQTPVVPSASETTASVIDDDNASEAGDELNQFPADGIVSSVRRRKLVEPVVAAKALDVDLGQPEAEEHSGISAADLVSEGGFAAETSPSHENSPGHDNSLDAEDSFILESNQESDKPVAERPVREEQAKQVWAAEEPVTKTEAEAEVGSIAPFTVVEDDGLDLNQPITLLMEQMKSRETDARQQAGETAGPQNPEPDVGIDGTVDLLDAGSDSGFSRPVADNIDSDISQQERESIVAAKSKPEPEPADFFLESELAFESSELHLNIAAAPLQAQSADSELAAVEAEFGSFSATDSSPDSAPATVAAELKSSAQKAVAQKVPFQSAAPSTTKAGSKKTANKAEKPAKKSRMSRLREEIQTSFFDMDPELAPEPEIEKKPASKSKNKPSRRISKKKVAQQEKAAAAPQQRDAEADTAESKNSEEAIVVISVAGRNNFSGKPLFHLLDACGMEFGEMGIFYRYEDGPKQGAVQFRMANAVKPGSFDLQDASFETPAVTFFLDMSEPRELMVAFDCMLATAKCVADNLDGVLKDGDRSVMRSQTIEHCRQQIRDYERRRLAKRA